MYVAAVPDTAKLEEIASATTDGSPRESIHEISALVIMPGGLNPPGKVLMVDILVDVTTNKAKSFFGKDTYQIDAKQSDKSESECKQIIENFRKAGLPPEFTELDVSAVLPGDLVRTAMEDAEGWKIEVSNIASVSDTIVCGFKINREDLTNGKPSLQIWKRFQMTPAAKAARDAASAATSPKLR